MELRAHKYLETEETKMSNRRWNTQNIPAKMKVKRIGYREGRRVLSQQQIDRLKERSKRPTKMGPKPNEKKMTPEQREKRFKRINFKKGSFPDMSGDGKITKKDILIAKGVIKKPKNKNG